MATFLCKTSSQLKKLWSSSKNYDSMPRSSDSFSFFMLRSRSHVNDLASDGTTSRTTLSSTSTEDTSSIEFDITDFRCKKCDSGKPCGQTSRCLNVVRQNMRYLLRHLPEEDVQKELASYYEAHREYEYYAQKYARRQAQLWRAERELAYLERQFTNPHLRLISPRLLDEIEKAKQKIAEAEKECENVAAEVEIRAQALFDQSPI